MDEKFPLNVVIVGGSIAGLMHGVMLTRRGHHVRVLEQSTENIRHGQAAGIRAGPEVQRFLKEFDQYKDQPYALDCPGMQFINKKSEYKRFINFPMQQTSWTMLYYRLRANFDGLVSKHCPNATRSGTGEAIYDLGRQLVSLTERDSQVEVEYKDLSTGKTLSLMADLVIGADGSHSAVRRNFFPAQRGQDRPYAGYLAWRGGVLESEVSDETRSLLKNNFTVFRMPKNYILVYTIPGSDGGMEPGQRILNFVWYHNCPDESDFRSIMTDTAGVVHRTTLQPGMMRPEIWKHQVQFAKDHLAAPFVELVEKTTEPFVAAVSDNLCESATFLNDKVILVGDALALFRPHIALSANQAAYDCLELQKVLDGQSTMAKWNRKVLWYGEATRQLSIVAGSFSQFGGWPLVKSVAVYGFVLSKHKVLSLYRALF
ncbi:FAD/NAD(P)-binding domain-containing protein [Aureobasidium subglaciale]|nr:FAD/NAD(P)-binding domain-containing protein [Aureobasidium subglaciale]